MVNLKLILIISLFLICMKALSSEEDSVFLPEIVVSPNRELMSIDETSSSIKLIGKKQMEYSAATSPSSLLQEFGGFNVAGNGGKGADPSYYNRGLARKYIKVLVDGMDLSDITSAQEEPTYIDYISTNNLEKIEILNGSQGTLYGSNAIGGVITFHSEKPSKIGLENIFMSEFGSFGTFKSGNTVKYLNENISLNLAINGERSHGYSSLLEEESTYLEKDGYNSYTGNFLINYKSPETFGKDRIANIAAVVFLYSLKNVLIIDAGSCITIDFVDKDGLYLGGRISPGLKMRYQALHHFTAKLPELTIQKEFPVLGNDTDSSIISGVQVGVLSEIQTVITDFKKENDDLFVIITGGDTFFFENALKSTIFADQDLVLKGLNEILKYNE